jgi:hypothetical protein
MISPHHIKSDGMVHVWDAELGAHVKMWPIDATHALTVEPERYFLERQEPAEVVAEETAAEETAADDPSKFGGETAL